MIRLQSVEVARVRKRREGCREQLAVCVMERIGTNVVNGSKGGSGRSLSGVGRWVWDVDSRRRKAEHSFSFFPSYDSPGGGGARSPHSFSDTRLSNTPPACARPLGIIDRYRRPHPAPSSYPSPRTPQGTEQTVGQSKRSDLSISLNCREYDASKPNTSNGQHTSLHRALLGGRGGERRALGTGVGSECA
jgi:hypothetical protein